MKLLIPMAISILVGIWVVPGLWRDFRAGVIFPGSMSIKRADHPQIYWLAFTVEACLILAWVTVMVMGMFQIIHEIPN